jgi:hypothetical protein
LHFKHSASLARISSSAIGLRQVLPVQTNRIIKLASRLSVASPTTPSRKTVNWLPATRTTEEGSP